MPRVCGRSAKDGTQDGRFQICAFSAWPGNLLQRAEVIDRGRKVCSCCSTIVTCIPAVQRQLDACIENQPSTLLYALESYMRRHFSSCLFSTWRVDSIVRRQGSFWRAFFSAGKTCPSGSTAPRKVRIKGIAEGK